MIAALGKFIGVKGKSPFWLVPTPIRKEHSELLLADWFKEENRYCDTKLSIGALFASALFFICIYLDTHYTPPADFTYALRGRGSLGLYFLMFFISTRFLMQRLGERRFIYSKILFGLGTFLAVSYQFQYSADYANRARYIPMILYVGGVFAMRVGPSFTAICTTIYFLIMVYFNLGSSGHFQEDLNHFLAGAPCVFFFQDRIYYEAIKFVSEWRERTRLAESEREAKVLASHAYNELTKLVYPHVVDQVQSGKKIEQTMPSGHSQAAVLCFDTVDSSKITHPDFPYAMEEFQAKLYALMSEHYDAKKMISEGYRIKDVGDGVFYSIGFPFNLPGSQNECDMAVDLAVKSIDLFHAIMGRLAYTQPITCGVGIGFGDVEGFFPRAGLQQYDLRGNAIVLASRYQGFRSRLRELTLTQPGQSILTISEETFRRLSSVNQARFNCLNIAEKSIKIRNDADAKHVYWTAINSTAQNNVRAA